jgi:hypothetical protein
MKADEPDNPVAVGLLGPIRIVMVAKHLTNLVHQSEILIWSELGLFFHEALLSSIDGKVKGHFSTFWSKYLMGWKISPDIGAV